ncbi:hypothetical protein KKG83_02650, partial [Candidatus Micrarchaeota archaeon]|nr:hypothetical protein [Candidatus Micrarchaeota archaeon]
QTGSLEGAMKVMRKRTFRKDLERRGLNVDELITKGKRMIKERQRMQRTRKMLLPKTRKMLPMSRRF